MKSNIVGNLLLLLFISFTYLNTIFAATGDLDLSFGVNGIARTDIAGTNDYPSAHKIQPDGKIVVAGYIEVSPSNFDIFVARFNVDGSRDTSFGTNGIVVTDILGHAIDRAYDLVIQPNDGKILVVGETNNGSGGNLYLDLAVLRYNTNGTLDPTFGNTAPGISMIAPNDRVPANSPSGPYGFSGNSIALQSNGQIIVGGTVDYFSIFKDGMIVRLSSNGFLDTSFGTPLMNQPMGYMTVDVRASDFLTKVAVLENQKIVAVGSSYSGGDSSTFDYLAVRLNSGGSFDGTFNGNGKLLIDFNGNISNDQAYDLTMQPDGKLLVTGFSQNTDYECSASRINVNGTLDSTFGGGDGLVNFNIGPSRDRCFGVALQPNGRIILSGIVRYGAPPVFDYAFLKLNIDGTLDRSFGRGTGIARISYPTGFIGESPNPLIIQKDGKIVSVGKGGTSTLDIMLLRVQNQFGTPFIDFDGDSRTDLSIFRPAPGEWWVSRSSDGGNFATQFGASTDRIVPADYTGDGKTDVAFWRPSSGQWFILRSEDSSFFAFPFGNSSDVPVPADYDGDGKADAAVFRESSLTWFIQKSSGGTDIIGFGAAGDKPVAADYDGDGKSDIAIYRPNGANGAEWWIRRSSNGSVFATQFGTASDKPVQGDFTGDGKADIAFFRPSNGNWFILRSEDFSFFAFPFGASGDVPVAGDYDGDGKFDAGVFRPTNQTWYVQRSTAGTLIQQFGIAGDLPTPNAFVP